MRKGVGTFDVNASKGQKKIAKLLLKDSVGWQVTQNYSIQISPTKTLYIDFFIHKPFICAIEYDGVQHKEYNKFFYKTIDDFENAKKNDKIKEEWCKDNDVPLLRVDYSTFDPDTFKSMLLKTIEKHLEVSDE